MAAAAISFLFFLSFLVAVTSAGGYGNDPNTPKPKLGEGYNYNPTKVMGIQGLIYCKYRSKLIPLKGAKTRITCQALDKNGYEHAPFSVSSCPADAKGYYFATVSAATELIEGGGRIKECKAFLENSPLEECNVPTDLNKGVSGALLSSPRLLTNINLYSLPPFFYTIQTKLKPKPKGY